MILPTAQHFATARAEARYETARRIGLALLRDPRTCDAETVFLLHDILVTLADFKGAGRLLEEHHEVLKSHRFQAAMKLAGDFGALAQETHYRTSPEKREGLTLDEYIEKCIFLAAEHYAEAQREVTDAETAEALRQALAAGSGPGMHQSTVLRAFEQHGIRLPGEAPPQPVETSSGTKDEPETQVMGALRGRIVFDDGSPAGGVTVTLGLPAEIHQEDPATFVTFHMHYYPHVAGQLQKLTTETSPDGSFTFEEVPAGKQEFLAVTLDPSKWEIPTRFLARSIQVEAGKETVVGDLVAGEWRSAPGRDIRSPHPQTLENRAEHWEKAAEWPLRNPFHYDFPRQLLRLPLPPGSETDSIRICVEPGSDEQCQVVDGEVAFMTSLPARTDRTIALYRCAKRGPARPIPWPKQGVSLVKESDSVWRIDTGTASFRVPGENAAAGTAPILSLRGCDGVWRGKGRFVFPEGVRILHQTTRIVHEGNVLLELEIRYELTGGRKYSLTLTALEGEAFLLVREKSPELEGAAFEFSLREFSGGRGFLQWGSETGSLHWTSFGREEALVARLAESIPWWIPPQGFAYAMTQDGLEEKDYIGVFSIRRGDWIDRKFERIAQGPIDEEGRGNWEMDWPYPEMVGSSISEITARTDGSGDAFFRFGFFDGERQWGLLASSLERNDGPWKELSAVQHANSSPRLQDFKDWHFDEPDAGPRPHVLTRREELPRLREKSRSERFGRLWGTIRESLNVIPGDPHGRGGHRNGPNTGLVFALEGDPLIAWRKRIDLVAISEIRSKMTLLGREWSDMYSPVGGRPITEFVADYDLIAGSGVFSPEEERSVRAFFILMAHMFMEPDLMNWKFNARNANFEADRTDIVGLIGLVFEGHPDSDKFLNHVIERTHRALAVYCTPGSGKWYENPACYYLHAATCRMNLVYHLAIHGRLDVESVPRLKDFLRWGILLLTPAQPTSQLILCNGGEEAFLAAEKVRKVPPIGDHAQLGAWLPGHYAFVGKLFLSTDPAFGKELLNAYFCSNADGLRLVSGGKGDGYTYGDGVGTGQLPVLFVAIEEGDLPVAPAVHLHSRKLEGFGAVIRDRVNTPEETYILIKQGPGGYRYQRTEGSFIFFANGRPLVYEGGEAGEAWRHNTLSFYDVHMPLAPGRVERFFADPAVQFVQGIHPKIIAPGQPDFLSDSCRHEAVEECYRRFKQEPPAVVRSFAWVGGKYLVVHDALDIPQSMLSHWHLQVVGDAPRGNAAGGYRFPGRFGTDLQVLVPSQTFDGEKVYRLPILEYRRSPEETFATQHLHLTKKAAKGYLAVLHPLPGSSNDEIAAEAVTAGDQIIGVRVRGKAFQDILWFDREGIGYDEGSVRFSGKYGAVLRREGCTTLVLSEPGELKADQFELVSDAPRAVLEITGEEARLRAQGSGNVHVRISGAAHDIKVDGEGEWKLPPTP